VTVAFARADTSVASSRISLTPSANSSAGAGGDVIYHQVTNLISFTRQPPDQADKQVGPGGSALAGACGCAQDGVKDIEWGQSPQIYDEVR
jgi:hypothetical protein